MKLNINHCKSILKTIQDSNYRDCDSNSFSGVSIDSVAYHLDLFYNAEIITARRSSHKDSSYPFYFNIELTLDGNDFAAQLTNENVFKKVVKKVENIGGTVSITILKELCKQAFKQLIE